MEPISSFALPSSAFNPKDFKSQVRPSVQYLARLGSLDFRLLQTQVENAKFAFNQDPLQVLTDEYLTIFYHANCLIHDKLNSADKQHVDWLLDNTIDFLCTNTHLLATTPPPSPDVLKVLTFLLCQALQACCLKNSRNIMDQDCKRHKPTDLHNKVAHYARKALLVLKTLTAHPIDDLNKFRLISETAFKLLESKQLLRKDEIKDAISDVIVLCLQKDPNSHALIQHRVVNLVYSEEDIIRPLIDIVHTLHDTPHTSPTVLAIVQLLADYALNNKFHVESQSIKNIFKFFQRLSELLPKIFNSNIQQFMHFYESDNYYLRNTASQIIGNIIMRLLNPQLYQDRDEEMKSQNEKQKYNLIVKLQSNCRVY